MRDENLAINIAYMYPDLLNNNGDKGNIRSLEQRLKWRNINVNIYEISPNTEYNYSNFDIFFFGGDESTKTIQQAMLHLAPIKETLKKEAYAGKIMLGICGGYQLLCNTYKNLNQETINCLGIIDADTEIKPKRFTGNVTVETPFLKDNILVGFEHHCGETFLKNKTKPIGKVIIGNGNNTLDKTEGAISNNVFGTYLQGPFLPKNINFCDYILQIAIRQKLKDNSYFLPKLNDNIETITHNNLIKLKY